MKMGRLEELGLMSRRGRVGIQSPLVAGGLGKTSDLNLKYMLEAQLPRTWALFWYSYCLVALSNFSFFGFSFFICNVIKISNKGSGPGNCLLTVQPFLYGDNSLSEVSLFCWLGVCVYKEGLVSKTYK